MQCCILFTGIYCLLGDVVHRGILSTGAYCPPGHIVYRGILSTRAYCLELWIFKGVIGNYGRNTRLCKGGAAFVLYQCKDMIWCYSWLCCTHLNSQWELEPCQSHCWLVLSGDYLCQLAWFMHSIIKSSPIFTLIKHKDRAPFINKLRNECLIHRFYL